MMCGVLKNILGKIKIAQRDDRRVRAPKQMYYVSAAVGHLFEQYACIMMRVCATHAYSI